MHPAEKRAGRYVTETLVLYSFLALFQRVFGRSGNQFIYRLIRCSRQFHPTLCDKGRQQIVQ